MDLVHVNISFTSLQEDLRRILEPRTSSVKAKLKTIETLANAGIPVNVMMAPIIPSINSHEIMDLVKAVADAGASRAHYLVVRLNGAIGLLFEDWVHKNFPDRASKVLKQIRQLHDGQLSDSRIGVRMKGEGVMAKQIKDQFELACRKYLSDKEVRPYNTALFRPRKKDQLLLF